MSQIEFDAKVSSIVKFEKQTGESIMKVFSNDGMFLTHLMELVKACAKGEITDDDIDAYVKANGLTSLITSLTQNLADNGFLEKDAQPTDEAPENL